MNRRELFKLGLAAGIAHALPKPKAMTGYRWDAQLDGRVRANLGIDRIWGEPMRFDTVQRTRSYNHMALHRSLD